MDKYFKTLFAMVIFPLSMLLAGCHSEGTFNSESQSPVDTTVAPVDATVIEITVTPSPVLVLEEHTQQLVAMAKYDDESETDISDSVTWEIVGDPTIADVSASGLLTGSIKGETELTASKGGITSDQVNVTVCDLADSCIDTIDTGNGKLLTNSPSVAYLDSIGGSATNGTYTNGTYTEDGTYGPDGDFYQFNLNNAHALCALYNTQSIAGRTNWRLATRDELKVELYDTHGEVFDIYSKNGWPTYNSYWSMTPVGGGHNYTVDLGLGNTKSQDELQPLYASCTSEP
ncbi:Ig-like domain-containing protein [Vibrio sp. Vb339]|uniref:Ig-like domain-containing protein n=1 Tax=Vibrio sp. Vb339 TaxID=1192013 RepID=UPI0015555335|nr:Ig-like domain-containing protein [Vibrio sp. Vb339]